MQAIERAASEHLGRPWTGRSFTNLDDLATHSSGIFHGGPFSVFAKLATDSQGVERFRLELAGLALLHVEARVMTPTPIGAGIVTLGHRSMLLLEALSERRPETRTGDDWRSIGFTLAQVHQAQRSLRTRPVQRVLWAASSGQLSRRVQSLGRFLYRASGHPHAAIGDRCGLPVAGTCTRCGAGRSPPSLIVRAGASADAAPWRCATAQLCQH